MRESKNLISNLNYSAKDLSLSRIIKLFWVGIFFSILVGVIDLKIILNLILLIGNVAIFFNQIFKIFLCRFNLKESNINAQSQIKEQDLPLYTILVPLYKEAAVAKQLVKNLSSLNYPKAKLQILLLCEEDDIATIAAFKNVKVPKYFQVLIVPNTLPKTKPKACNYGLEYAKGKYITIYDADDKPDINQLRDVVAKFNNLTAEYICIQAKLNYYNRKENFLTKLFAIEYYHWFEIMLPNLYQYKMIIPLGGTSNHFITQKLCEIGGWDAYNVTEDAELGLRIGVKKFKTYLLDSITLEEAPLTIKSWLVQRSRWIKGYIQTYILYLKDIQRKSGFNIKENIGFHFFVGLPMISFILLPLIISIMVIAILSKSFEVIFLCKILGLFNLLLMIFLPIIIAILVFKKSNWQVEILSIISYPFYWFLHTISSYRALYYLFKMTYYWDKTEHGLTRVKHSLYKEKS